MIYFIRCGDFVKIGTGEKPSKRLTELQVGNPFSLEIIGVTHGGVAEERELQKRFSAFALPVKQYLEDHKSEVVQVVIKACVSASDAVATSMAEKVKKTMSDDYHAKKVFGALFDCGRY